MNKKINCQKIIIKFPNVGVGVGVTGSADPGAVGHHLYKGELLIKWGDTLEYSHPLLAGETLSFDAASPSKRTGYVIGDKYVPFTQAPEGLAFYSQDVITEGLCIQYNDYYYEMEDDQWQWIKEAQTVPKGTYLTFKLVPGDVVLIPQGVFEIDGERYNRSTKARIIVQAKMTLRAKNIGNAEGTIVIVG